MKFNQMTLQGSYCFSIELFKRCIRIKICLFLLKTKCILIHNLEDQQHMHNYFLNLLKLSFILLYIRGLFLILRRLLGRGRRCLGGVGSLGQWLGSRAANL